MMNRKKREEPSIALKVFFLIVPFVLVFTAIILLTLWLFNNVIASSPVYGLLTSSLKVEYALPDEVYLEKIKQQNVEQNFGSPEGFPLIAYGQEWARLTVEGTERINNVKVNAGDSYDLMMGAAGFSYNSSYPGLGGKTVISGHVKQEFRELENIPVGTRVYLDTIYGEYEYEVYDIVIFNEDEYEYVLDDGTQKNVLMLYTCYPYASATRRTQRLALMCRMISGRDWTEVDSGANG